MVQEIKEGIKLNLGSRTWSIPGFKNVDIDNHEGVDMVCDVGDIHNHFDIESISEIYASHILEHFPHTRTLEILNGWYRILEKGGVLYVGVPDFSRTVEIYKKTGMQNWIVNYLWGDQQYGTAFHYTGFDEGRLRNILNVVGFSEISRVEQFPFKTNDCSTNKSNIDGKSVSLNMVAIK